MLERGPDSKISQDRQRYRAIVQQLEQSDIPDALNEQLAAYLVAWCEKINPQHAAQRWLYPGIGPDLLTPLLAADATVIDGIDIIPLDLKKVAELSSDPRRIASSYFHSHVAHSERKQTGYFGVPRYQGEESVVLLTNHLALELSRIGAEVKVIQGEGSASAIQFLWAFPGQEPKLRTVRYLPADFKQLAPLAATLYDQHYEGLMMKSVYSMTEKNLDIVEYFGQHHLKPGGHMLINPTSNYVDERLRAPLRRSMGRDLEQSLSEHFKSLSAPFTATEELARYYRSRRDELISAEYGVYFRGFEKVSV